MSTTISVEERMEALRAMFAEDRARFEERGWFKRRYGFGERPALLIIDMQNGCTQPGTPWSCDNMDVIIDSIQQLLRAARAARAPVIYTRTAFHVTEGDFTEMGVWNRKIPVELLTEGVWETEIDDRIAPLGNEVVITKKRTSAFYGTELTSILSAAQVDTLVIVGLAVPACVRHSAEDAVAASFPPVVVREAVGDRVPGSVEWNLFDIDARVADVESVQTTVANFERVAAARAARS